MYEVGLSFNLYMSRVLLKVVGPVNGGAVAALMSRCDTLFFNFRVSEKYKINCDGDSMDT